MRTSTHRLLVLVTAAAAAVLPSVLPAPGPRLAGSASVSEAVAGCLAPADIAVDSAGVVGPFAGNESGSLLYARDLTGDAAQLMLLEYGAFPVVVAAEGDANDFYIGPLRERWAAFHTGTMNGREDLAFVASTALVDDPNTPENESLARRGAYVRRGNTFFELGRSGGASPFPAFPSGTVPWGSFFEMVALGRAGTDPFVAYFTAQLGAPDGRTGIFRWSEANGVVEAAVLAGDAAPVVGEFTSFGRLRGNEAGDLAVFATTQVGQDASSAAAGLFLLDRSGGRMRIARSGTGGDALPGGGTLRSLGEFDVAGDGTVVFAGTLEGGGAASALFRAAPPLYTIERLYADGGATPIGGTFAGFGNASVRIDEAGDLAFCVALSADIGGTGLFTVASGATEVEPLGTAKDFVLGAGLGAGRIAYQTPTATHVVAAADGSAEGPDDFRIVLADLKNLGALKKDSLRADLRFRLAPWGEAPPASFRSGVERFTTTASLSGVAVTRIADVRLAVSQSPGQEFSFSIGGTDNNPMPAASVNGNTLAVKGFSASADGLSATWKFSGSIGTGSFSCDLRAGAASLKLSQGNLLPSFEPNGFKVAMTLRSAADVAAARTGAACFFHRDLRVSADQPSFGSGRRVLTKGETVPGGTFFIDTLRDTRKLKVTKGVAAPVVSGDTLTLAGTLRLCPGATAPATPTLPADVVVGSVGGVGGFDLSGITLTRVGKTGSRYRFQSAKGAKPSVRFDLDVTGAKFSLKASSLPPLPELVDADFAAPAASPNADDHEVGGMMLPVLIRISRVYEAAQDVAIVRLRGGKVFTR